MNDMIAWIAAEAERPEVVEEAGFRRRRRIGEDAAKAGNPAQGLGSHQFPAREVRAESGAQSPLFAKKAKDGAPSAVSISVASEFPSATFPASDESLLSGESAEEVEDRVRQDEKERRTYRGRTVAMLRRYMRYSIETGRLPSLLGGEMFRAKVTTYTVVTFEDRVIFVHDMETCLRRLDEFSRQLIARHILQEHDQAATGKLLHCTERTVRTYIPVVLDVLSQILVEVGLLERLDSNAKKSCQGGKSDPISASDCEDGKYKV